MATKNTIKIKRRKLQANFLDMDENIFRKIFQYIDAWLLYSKLRFVCRKVNDYEKGYIKLVPEKLFLHSPHFVSNLSGQWQVDVPLEYLMILKHTSGTIASICSRILPAITSPVLDCYKEITRKHRCDGCSFQTAFFDTIAEMIVVGYFYAACSNCKPKTLSSSPTNTYDRAQMTLNKINTDGDGWRFFVSYYDSHAMKWCPINVLGDNSAYAHPRIYDGVCTCICGNTILVLLYQWPTEDGYPILKRYNFKEHATSKLILKLDDYKNEPESEFSQLDAPISLMCSVKEDHFRFEEEVDMYGIKGCSLVKVDENKTMIVGGFYEQLSSRITYNQKLWEAVITDETEDLKFKAINSNPVQPRLNPMCFKLGDNVYIAGGGIIHTAENIIDCCTGFDKSSYIMGEKLWHHLCCDRYHVKERKYYRTEHRLPFLFEGFSRVATDQSETFCIIKIFTNLRNYNYVFNIISLILS